MTVFHSNCTLPQERTGLVLSPNTRGTFDILWSCFSIFILSTWSILHLNVPAQSIPNSKAQDFMRKTKRFLAKLKWMAANIVAPEWVLGRAWSDYLSVSILEQRFECFRKADKVPWSRTHSYFANMGGFAIRFTEETRQVEEIVEPDAPDSPSIGTAETFQHQETNSPRILPCTQRHTTIVCENGASEETAVASVDPNAVTLPTRSTWVPQVASSSQSNSGDLQLGTNGSSPGSVSAEERGLQIEIDEENGEFHKEQLPAYIEAFLRIRQRRGKISSESLKKPMEDLSRIIGPIDWMPNDNNMHTIEKCLEIVTMEHFKSKWERRQFLNYYDHWFHNLFALQGDLWVLDAHQLLIARELGIIENLPNVRKDDLDDRNKGDALIKVLALGQVVWFFLQMGERLGYQIPTSQLEIVALSFAVCTGLAYGLLLDKPKDASTAVIANGTRYPTAEEMIRIAIAGPPTWGFYRRSIWIPNNAIHRDSKLAIDNMTKMNQGIMLALIIFGAVHCVAWDFYFPTQVEKLLWRVCSLATIAVLPLGIGFFFIIFLTWRLVAKQEGQPFKLKYTGNMVVYSLTFVFVICRLFIIVEVFRSLVDLPIGAFRTTWSANLPHWG